MDRHGYYPGRDSRTNQITGIGWSARDQLFKAALTVKAGVATFCAGVPIEDTHQVVKCARCDAMTLVSGATPILPPLKNLDLPPRNLSSDEWERLRPPVAFPRMIEQPATKEGETTKQLHCSDCAREYWMKRRRLVLWFAVMRDGMTGIELEAFKWGTVEPRYSEDGIPPDVVRQDDGQEWVTPGSDG